MATATYNRADCTCGHDHDTLRHIAAMSMLKLAEASSRGEHITPWEFGEAIERAARKVGWVKTFKEEEK